jgi:superfamily II DNA or RNA helicase
MSKININLEQNGRIFPLWIMKNFNKYILPEIIRIEGEDPCNEERLNDFTNYQKFIGQYLSFESPCKELLIYHGVGAGKTASVINTYNLLYNYTPKWNIFILIPASLHDDPWLKDIKKWMSKNDYDNRFKNIIFIHYDSPFADKDFLEKIKLADANNNTMFVIEESHKFITNVYNNITSKTGKRAQVIYEYIQQEKKENNNIRIMLLSATPAVNNPFEFALIFNLLRPGTFPASEALFEQLFISSSNYTSLNDNNKNIFQRRIMGLVSYYIGATPDKYAQKIMHYISIPMEKYQEEIYNFYEEIEIKKEKAFAKMSYGKVGVSMSTYSSYTRQTCNFVFPNISESINGEKRPRPSHFNIKETDAIILEESKNLKKKMELTKSKVEVLQYIELVNNFISSLIKYFKEIYNQDKENNHTIFDDINNFHNKYNGSFSKFFKDNKTSKLFKLMNTCSPKYIRIIFNIEKTKGTILIYSNYVAMEGLQILKIYLNLLGFIDVESDKLFNKNNLKLNDNLLKNNFRYCEFHGGIEKNLRRINKEIFNDSYNKYGKYIKIIMISPAGAEGINLSNVRQVHILEPYWNEVRIEQVIGRALRFCEHRNLPLEERKVDIFRYKMIRNSGNETSDEKLENISRKKYNLLLSFIDAIKEVAVDCELFKAHNMMNTQYKCFQFNEESLFDNPIGPAYQSKIEYDLKINNGLNSRESNKIKIKVKKIRAVIKLNDIYSEENYYWFYDVTGIVYNYELNYPIGRISKDDNGLFEMLDDNVYIISYIIDIPNFNIYE